jgi:hypothetical protein
MSFRAGGEQPSRAETVPVSEMQLQITELHWRGPRRWLFGDDTQIRHEFAAAAKITPDLNSPQAKW